MKGKREVSALEATLRDQTPEEQEQMRVCFGVREEAFRAGETIYDFSEGRKYLGLIAHGSAVLQRIVTEAFDRGLSGLEFAVGIPGTVGGAVSMNAGTVSASSPASSLT